MDITDSQSTNYIRRSFTSILSLAIYWGITYFITNKTWPNDFSIEHIVGSIEFLSAIVIILIIIYIVCHILGSFTLGIIVGLLVCMALCLWGDKYMKAHNISDIYVEYFLLGIGILFNFFMLIRFILSIYKYITMKKASTFSVINDDANILYDSDTLNEQDMEKYIQDKARKERTLMEINENLKRLSERHSD